MAHRQNAVEKQGRSRQEGGGGPMRRCLASGVVRPKEQLLRFVVAPDGALIPDLAGRLPGRGLWLSPRRDMLEKACARNLFARAAKAPVAVPRELPVQLVDLLRQRCLDLLGLAGRAGQVVGGFERAHGQLKAGKVGVLLQAVDGSEGGRRKLRLLAGYANPAVAVFEILCAEELGRALGRPSWVHVAVAPGGIAARLNLDLKRLATLEGKGDWISES